MCSIIIIKYIHSCNTSTAFYKVSTGYVNFRRWMYRSHSTLHWYVWLLCRQQTALQQACIVLCFIKDWGCLGTEWRRNI